MHTLFVNNSALIPRAAVIQGRAKSRATITIVLSLESKTYQIKGYIHGEA